MSDAILVTEDDQVVSVNLPADPEHFTEYTAALLRAELIEHVTIGDGLHLWLNEEAIGQQGRNFLATRLVQAYPGGPSSLTVVGPVLLTGHHGDHVEPLDDDAYRRLAMALRSIAGHP